MKVNSPRQLAIYSALFSSLIIAACLALLQPLNLPTVGLIFAIALGAFISVYFLSYFLIEKFLYGKIKLIYKNILNLKTKKDNDLKIKMDDDVLGAVSQEVESWAENKSKEIQALREQEAFRREFLGNLAHELKTPVFSIQGYILTLLEGGLEDPTVNKEFLLRASKGVDRMTHIIEDLDVIMKMESGRLPMKIKKENIVGLAAEIMESVESKAKRRNVTVRFKENYDKPIDVMMDRARIGQVFTNLIHNSINYCREEGGYVEIRFYRMDDRLLVEVADNGLGISKVHLPRLFERFYRVDKSRSRHMGGTGLGLAIVKHIVESHGQTINVRSTEGVGSTFSFTLDIAK